MEEDAFKAAIEGCEQQRDVNARQVGNGFVLAGNIRYIIPATKSVRVQQSFEAIATDARSAGASLAQFLLTGDFGTAVS